MHRLITDTTNYQQLMLNNSNSARQRRNSDAWASPTQCTQQHFYLTERGAHQAMRNRSDQIWWTMGSNPTGYSLCYFNNSERSTKPSHPANRDQTQLYSIDRPQKPPQQNNEGNKTSLEKSNRPKNVSFSLDQQKPINVSEQANSKVVNKASLTNQAKGTILEKKTDRSFKSKQKRKLTKEQEEQRSLFLRECYSIEKYLKSNKAYTREMPNSAVKLFYQMPCIEAYGRKNTSGNNGFIYNDFMKTHNVLPHRLGNEPAKYQSYRSALNFCKRTKIDPQDRWRKIHRQMRKKLNMKQLVSYFAEGTIDIDTQTLEEALRLNINTIEGTRFERSKSLTNLSPISLLEKPDASLRTDKQSMNTTKATSSDLKQTPSDRISSLKRSKSWGKKQYLFLYKYKDKDGDTQYCKDRHGITCYVDPTFEQNKQAYTKFLKRIKPIEAEDVAPADRNIDGCLMRNFALTQEQEIPQHYLMPNCSQPERYKAEKYSIKARKRGNVSEIRAQI